ncbi:hypothetical protein [Salinigranum marinum]|uniref:hypothetical protein n=1 Tax=Salinigranum marinum TaxID=1515595 RepID=UPI002989F4DF|nr:hypothetical protein [Salinigranum marinum]
MGDIDIPAGETVKIVNEEQAYDTWKASITGGDILVGHHRQEVKRNGDRIKAGDRVRLSNLGGSALYAYTDDDGVTVSISEAAVDIDFMVRTVVGSVQADDGSEVAPASAAFVHRQDTAVDVNASAVSESFEAPDRADFVVVAVDDADGSFHVEVAFQDDSGTDVVVRDDGDLSDYAGDSTTNVLVRAAVASPHVQVRIVDDSGAQNELDYSIYAR